jgi:hypothetical protein
MSKYKTVQIAGHWEDEEPEEIYHVTVALGYWDGVEDAEDEGIFFYLDGEPLEVGAVVGDGFVVTEIENNEVTA